MKLPALRPSTLRVGMLAAVLAVFLIAYVDLRREQARALEDFTAEQTGLAVAVANSLAARLEAVARDLAAAADAQATPRAAAALDELLRANPWFSELDVFDDDGTARLRRGTAPLYEMPRAAEHELALAAPRADGLRVLARARAGVVVAALVDTSQLFGGLVSGMIDAAPAPMTCLVVDDAGRWSRVTAPLGWHAPSAAAPALAAVLPAMRERVSGAALLDWPAAASLGLGERTAVAGYARVAVPGRAPWSVAVVTSAMRMRDRARVAAWRLGGATGLAAVLVALFGVVVSRQRRRAQELAEALRLSQATAALRERSEKIVEAIPVGVLALDRALRVTAVNPYLAERGIADSVPLGEALARVGADDLALLTALIAEARATGQATARRSLRLHLYGDGLRDVDVYVVVLSRPLADIDCFLVMHDRTELRVLERNLVRAEKLATIGTLAAGVAHEVGTPLGIISGRAEQMLARLGASGDEGQKKAAASILAQVDKVSSTIRQLLDFARARPVEATAVTPAQALGQAAALLEHRFRQAKVTLTVDAPPTLPPARADAGQLEQVLVNLLINACDACPAGGTVLARAEAGVEQVVFEVADDGAGIAEEHLPLVLDPFFTTKKRGQGTGLGLSIAADIVKNHGGVLAVESALGRGTTIRFTLPRAEP